MPCFLSCVPALRLLGKHLIDRGHFGAAVRLACGAAKFGGEGWISRLPPEVAPFGIRTCLRPSQARSV